jgi:hypothetical protein
MTKKKSGAKRRVAVDTTRSEWKSVGKFLTHILGGAAMLLGLVVCEGFLIMALHWITSIVRVVWFSGVVDGLDAILFIIDAGLLVWWVLKSIQKVRKEMGNE